MDYHLYTFMLCTTLILMVIIVFFELADSNYHKIDIFKLLSDVFILAPILGSILGLIIFFFVSHIVIEKSDLDTEEVIKNQYKIVSLEKEKGKEGKYSTAFFVGSGYVRDEHYYVYYKQYTNGDIKFEKVRAENVFLNQSGDEPKVVEYGNRYINVSDNKWLPPQHKKEIRSGRTVIYIPKGTIKENFKIN